jgi:hypothetical protein
MVTDIIELSACVYVPDDARQHNFFNPPHMVIAHKYNEKFAYPALTLDAGHSSAGKFNPGSINTSSGKRYTGWNGPLQRQLASE